jgi:hypothetical protein
VSAGLLGLRVRMPPGAWMSVCCECCLFSSRGLCVGLITCQQELYRVIYGVSACDCEALTVRRPWPIRGCRAMEKIRKRYAFKHDKFFHARCDIIDYVLRVCLKCI